MDDTASAMPPRGGDTGGGSLCYPRPLGGNAAPAKASTVECGEESQSDKSRVSVEFVGRRICTLAGDSPRARRTGSWERNSPKLGAGRSEGSLISCPILYSPHLDAEQGPRGEGTARVGLARPSASDTKRGGGAQGTRPPRHPLPASAAPFSRLWGIAASSSPPLK